MPRTKQREPRKICLVGTASSRDAAPVDDPSWEIWGLAARGNLKRATRWIEAHRLDGEPQAWANGWRKIMRTFADDTDLYMFYPEPLGKKVKQFPVDELAARFGTYFMTSSFAWAMAMAINEMAPIGKKAVAGDTIMICGVDMEYGTEYREQRVGFRHMMQVAKHFGIQIERIVDSGLSYEPIPYPMWQDDPVLNKSKLRLRQTVAQMEEWEGSLKNTRMLLDQDEFGLMMLDEIEGKLGDMPPAALKEWVIKKRAELSEEKVGLLKRSDRLSRQILQAEGAKGEQEWLHDYLQP
jgi:hypothetical protein